MDYTRENLIRYLEFPQETLNVEYKGWLDLSDNQGKATLAKAAIALANTGGGIVVLGFDEDNDDGNRLIPQPFPDDLISYSLDDINSAIGRYTDPSFHCRLEPVEHPETRNQHFFVIVPSMDVPVMCRRTCEGVINARRCYIRKPGPKSEEPFTHEEWRSLLDRCVRQRRDDLLDAFRMIMLGGTNSLEPSPTNEAILMSFMDEGRDRWQHLMSELPEDDPARMPNGHYEIAFFIEGIGSMNLTELNELLRQSSRVTLTGWPPFLVLHRDPFMPHPIAGTIENWLGANAELPLRSRDPASCDFWRVSPDGKFFTIRGYNEDSSDRVRSGEVFDYRLPIWRVGEALLFVARFANLIDENLKILTICEYKGLQNRTLSDAIQPNPLVWLEGHTCYDDTATLIKSVTVSQIEDNLAEFLHQFLTPLYEKFSFYQLDRAVVTQEIQQLRSRRR